MGQPLRCHTARGPCAPRGQEGAVDQRARSSGLLVEEHDEAGGRRETAVGVAREEGDDLGGQPGSWQVAGHDQRRPSDRRHGELGALWCYTLAQRLGHEGDLGRLDRLGHGESRTYIVRREGQEFHGLIVT